MTGSMTMKTGADLRFEAGSWQEAMHDIYIGLLVGMGHVYKIFVQMPYAAVFGSSSGSGSSLPSSTQGELKVVGVGFGRTGTVRDMCYCICICSMLCVFLEVLTSRHLFYLCDHYRLPTSIRSSWPWKNLAFRPFIRNICTNRKMKPFLKCGRIKSFRPVWRPDMRVWANPIGPH